MAIKKLVGQEKQFNTGFITFLRKVSALSALLSNNRIIFPII